MDGSSTVQAKFQRTLQYTQPAKIRKRALKLFDCLGPRNIGFCSTSLSLLSQAPHDLLLARFENLSCELGKFAIAARPVNMREIVKLKQ